MIARLLWSLVEWRFPIHRLTICRISRHPWEYDTDGGLRCWSCGAIG